MGERDNGSSLAFSQDYFLYGWMRATHNAARMYVLANCDHCCPHATWVLPSRPDPWKDRDSESNLLYVCTLLWSVLFLCISLRRVLVKIAIVFVPCTNHQCLCHCLGHSLTAGLTCCCQWCVHCILQHTSLDPLILPKIHLFQKRSAHCLHGYAL